MNKKAAGFTWIYGLAFLFALGILYAVFHYVFEVHLVPSIEIAVNTTIHDAAERQAIMSGIHKYQTFFEFLPYILFFIVIVYMFARTIYQETTGGGY